jgi:hypothetical protein
MTNKPLAPLATLITLALGLTGWGAARAPRSADPVPGPFPLVFEESRGPAARRADFVAAGNGASLRLRAQEVAVTLAPPAGRRGEPDTLVMALLGSAPGRRLRGEESQGTASSFFGADPAGWVRQVPAFRRVRGRWAYPGIDVVYYGRDGRLEYDFVVAPGARPDVIRLAFRDGQGEAARVSLAGDGDLLIRSGGRVYRQSRPVVYQELDGKRRPIEGRYAVLARAEVGFELGKYDAALPLVIDPVLRYFEEPGAFCTAIALDAGGFPYLAGSAYREEEPDYFALSSFIRKYTPDGSRLVYSLNFGGTGTDYATDIAVDASGAACVTGTTDSFDFPTVNAVQPRMAFDPDTGWYQDAFVLKASPSGAGLIYSTYLGGSEPENVWEDGGIAVDPEGSAYVVGATASTDFPVVNAVQPERRGPVNFDPFLTDGFVSKLSADGGTLVYSTYLGGDGADALTDVAVASDGSVALCGFTESANFPAAAAIQPARGSEHYADAFVTRLDAGGSALIYSTYLGGNHHDAAQALAIDGSGAVTVTGVTTSTDFPLVNAFQSLIQPRPIPDIDLIPIDTSPYPDAFVTRLAPDGGALQFSTYLGGTFAEVATDVALDNAGSAVVTGITDSHDFPALDSAPRAYERQDLDGFVARFRPDGSSLLASSLLGTAARSEVVTAVAVNAAGDQYASGYSDEIQVPGELAAARLRAGVELRAAAAGTPPAGRRARAFLSLLPPRTRRGPGKLRASARRLRFRGQAGERQRTGLFLLNTGGGPVTGTIGTLSAPFRVRTGSGAFTLQAGQTLPIIVEMEPDRAGTFRGRLMIRGTRPRSRAAVELLGRVRQAAP